MRFRKEANPFPLPMDSPKMCIYKKHMKNYFFLLNRRCYLLEVPYFFPFPFNLLHHPSFNPSPPLTGSLKNLFTRKYFFLAIGRPLVFSSFPSLCSALIRESHEQVKIYACSPKNTISPWFLLLEMNFTTSWKLEISYPFLFRSPPSLLSHINVSLNQRYDF